jgi:hypothetical protein
MALGRHDFADLVHGEYVLSHQDYFGKDEKTMRENGLPSVRKVVLRAALQAFLRAGTTRCAPAQTPFGGGVFFCVNTPLSLLCDNTGVAGSSCLQHLGTSGHRFKWLLMMFSAHFLTLSAFDWRVAFQQGAQQADLKRPSGATS